MSNFKKGDKVRVKDGVTTDFYGDEFDFREFEIDSTFPEETPPKVGTHSQNRSTRFHAFDIKDIERVPAFKKGDRVIIRAGASMELHWNDVRAGDTVTFRVDETGQEITTEALAADRRTHDPDRVRILGRYFKDGWTLLSVVKAKEPLPTDNGAVIKVTAMKDPRADAHLPFFLHRIKGAWVYPSGVPATDRVTLPEIVSWERVL